MLLQLMKVKSNMVKRQQLYKLLPLATPLSLHIFPTFFCNLKCNYCLHSLSQLELDKISFKKQSMSFDIFQKAIDNLSEFPKRLKALIFAGHGEPLLNKNIVEMVRYAKRNRVAERIEIVTNATLLTKELSEQLISAGLDRLRISIQGLTSEKYEHITGIPIDFGSLVKNIAYFFSSRNKCEVYVKIVDAALVDDYDKEHFINIFKDISDIATIEYIIPFINSIDYTNLRTDLSKTKMGGHICNTNICSMPFYMLVLNPDGSVLPCCSTEIPIIYDNVLKNSLSQIWNSNTKNKFLYNQLKNKNSNKVCKKCSVPECGLQEGDYLDEYTEQLIKLYK